MSEEAKREHDRNVAEREYGEPQLLICHTCEAQGGRHRTVARTAGEHNRFMDQHRECARNGWGTTPGIR